MIYNGIKFYATALFVALMICSCGSQRGEQDKRTVDTPLTGTLLRCEQLQGEAFRGIYGDRLFVESSDKIHCLVEYRLAGDSLVTAGFIGTRGRSGLEFDIPLVKVIGDTLYAADMQGYGGMLKKLVSIPLSDGSSAQDQGSWKIRDLDWAQDIICGTGFTVDDDGRLIVTGSPMG